MKGFGFSFFSPAQLIPLPQDDVWIIYRLTQRYGVRTFAPSPPHQKNICHVCRQLSKNPLLMSAVWLFGDNFGWA